MIHLVVPLEGPWVPEMFQNMAPELFPITFNKKSTFVPASSPPSRGLKSRRAFEGHRIASEGLKGLQGAYEPCIYIPQYSLLDPWVPELSYIKKNMRPELFHSTLNEKTRNIKIFKNILLFSHRHVSARKNDFLSSSPVHKNLIPERTATPRYIICTLLN